MVAPTSAWLDALRQRGHQVAFEGDRLLVDGQPIDEPVEDPAAVPLPVAEGASSTQPVDPVVRDWPAPAPAPVQSGFAAPPPTSPTPAYDLPIGALLGGASGAGGSGLSIGQRAAAGPLTAGFPDTFTAPRERAIGEWQAPTVADLLADPSYQFRRDQGLATIQRTAAGRGVLNDTGTMRALIDYAGNAASQEYGDKWNRDRGVFSEDRGITLGRNAQDYDRAWAQYLQNYGIWRDTQDRNFNKLYQYATA